MLSFDAAGFDQCLPKSLVCLPGPNTALSWDFGFSHLGGLYVDPVKSARPVVDDDQSLVSTIRVEYCSSLLSSRREKKDHQILASLERMMFYVLICFTFWIQRQRLSLIQKDPSSEANSKPSSSEEETASSNSSSL